MSVKRYDLTQFPAAEAFGPDDHGRYVEHSDYAALEAERDQLRRDRDTLAGECRRGRESRQASVAASVNMHDIGGRSQRASEMYRAAIATTDASGAMGRYKKEGGAT